MSERGPVEPRHAADGLRPRLIQSVRRTQRSTAAGVVEVGEVSEFEASAQGGPTMAEKPQNTPSSIEPTMIRKVLQQAHRDKALAAMSGCLFFSSSSSLSPGRVTVRRSIRRSA